MTTTDIQRALDNKEQTTGLILYGKSFEELPEEIFELTKLEEIEISNTKLSVISERIGELEKLTTLSLNNNQLESLPTAFAKLKNLKRLYLNKNHFEETPKPVFEIEGLKSLSMENNEIEEVGEGLCNLVALTDLRLSQNNISSLPKKFGRLKQLRHLMLDQNQLKRLPNSFGDCENLEMANLVKNQIKKLPETIGQLKKLRHLNLSRNQLKELPTSIQHCENLQNFILRFNKLKELPAFVGLLASLKQFSISNNKISSLPDELGQCKNLSQLALARNQIRQLPYSIYKLPVLRWMDLEGNQLKVLPKELLMMPNLRVLNLNKNKIEKIETPLYANRINSLKLKFNRIKSLPEDWSHFSQLKEIWLDRNPIEQFSESMLQLNQLHTLGGLTKIFNQKEKRFFLRFIKTCKKYDVSLVDRQFYFHLAITPKENAKYEKRRLLKALQFKMQEVQQAALSLLFQQQAKTLKEVPLQKGSRLVLAGKTILKAKDLTEPFSVLGIQLDKTITFGTTHILLAAEPKNIDTIVQRPDLVFINDRQLNDLLKSKKEKVIEESTFENAVAHLNDMLVSDNATNVEIALQLIDTAGFSPSILTGLYIASKKIKMSKLNRRIKKLLFLNTTPEEQALMKLPIQVLSSEAIRKIFDGSASPKGRSRIDAEMIIEHLK